MAKPTNQPKSTVVVDIGRVIVYITYGVVLFAEFMLLFRIVFLLFSANPSAPFVQFVYNTSNDFLAPFRGIFPPHPVAQLGYLDVSAIFALVVYLLVAWGVEVLIGLLTTGRDT